MKNTAFQTYRLVFQGVVELLQTHIREQFNSMKSPREVVEEV